MASQKILTFGNIGPKHALAEGQKTVFIEEQRKI
jgi:hypothetical protein